MFSITPGASREILAAVERSGAAGMALRVAARRAEDGDIEYGMGFDEVREEDDTLDCLGVTIALGAPSKALLERTVLDFVEVAPGELGFVFLDAAEAAEPSGGCGTGGCGSCGGGRCGT